MKNTVITIQADINAPIEKVWTAWTTPEDIVKWNAASADWHTTRAENDLRVGGRFSSRMEAKDGSMGFDFSGVYTVVKLHELIEYKLGDDRKVSIQFSTFNDKTKVIESFDAEETNPIEVQRTGWQAILNNFKRHVESKMENK